MIFNESIRQTSDVRGTSLKFKYRGPSRGYDLAKLVRIKGRTRGFFNRHDQSSNDPPKDPVDRKESDMSIDTQPGEEFMQSEEHTSELQSRGLISYAAFCLKKR